MTLQLSHTATYETKFHAINTQARHNLCVVAVEMGHLEEAEKCLLEVRSLAPELEYVERHLEIVRNRIKLVRAERETTTSKDPGDVIED